MRGDDEYFTYLPLEILKYNRVFSSLMAKQKKSGGEWMEK